MNTPNSRPAVVTETSLDESFLVGTKEQLTELAHSILRLVEGPSETSIWQGITVQQPVDSRTVTEPMSEVAICGVTVVKSEADRRVLVNYFRTINGDAPIHWAGHERLQKGQS